MKEIIKILEANYKERVTFRDDYRFFYIGNYVMVAGRRYYKISRGINHLELYSSKITIDDLIHKLSPDEALPIIYNLDLFKAHSAEKWFQ